MRPRILDLEDLPTRAKRRAALTQAYAVNVGGASDAELFIDYDFGRNDRRTIADMELRRRSELELG